MKIRFDNSEFTNVHGATPRGWGLWSFKSVCGNGVGGYTELMSCVVTGTLTEAKRAAKEQALAEARTIGCAKSITVFVQP